MGGYQFNVTEFAGDEDIQWITRGGKHIPIKSKVHLKVGARWKT
jgi:hypothetical protein